MSFGLLEVKKKKYINEINLIHTSSSDKIQNLLWRIKIGQNLTAPEIFSTSLINLIFNEK